MIVHTQKVMPILSICARAYRVFLTSCVGIDLGDIPRGQRHPRYVPSVDPSTLGRKTLYELASLKYCYITDWGKCVVKWCFIMSTVVAAASSPVMAAMESDQAGMIIGLL